MMSEKVNHLEVITDAEHIRLVSNDPTFDRNFVQPTSLGNHKRLMKMLRVFSVNRQPFPTMCPRTDAMRAAAQDQLWTKLDMIAQEIKFGPVELEPMAEWVRGIGSLDMIGPLVQTSVGRLFVENFASTKESWAAACMILEAAGSSNEWKMLWWRVSGKLELAKQLLSKMVNGDLSAVNGIGVALHHIVDGLLRMRELATDPSNQQLDTDVIVNQCLFAPNSVIRLAKSDGAVGGCPFRKGTLFVLGLVDATKGGANRDLVFLSQSWSRCPAESWVPALLEGVWRRASTLPKLD
jgi:hypothetical protein